MRKEKNFCNETYLIQFVCFQDSQETESKATRWTDEKHSLYLKSMEASFVDQLYNSLDMLGWSPDKECSADRKVSSQKHNGKGTPTPSGQVG